MPFTEYRGGGKSRAKVESMESRWDAEWAPSQGEAGVPNMAANENWGLIRRSFPPSRILEAGCGIAKWVAFLDSMGYEAHGLDYSVVAIEKSLARWPNLRLAKGDLRAMPYADGFFDGIVSFGAIEHDIKGPQAALSDMYRVLRPGGVLYCTVSLWCQRRVVRGNRRGTALDHRGAGAAYRRQRTFDKDGVCGFGVGESNYAFVSADAWGVRPCLQGRPAVVRGSWRAVRMALRFAKSRALPSPEFSNWSQEAIESSK